MLKRLASPGSIILLISLIAYVALAVWMTQVWEPLGDEPHYLLAAHSLVYDHDLNLANNYAQKDFSSFFKGDTLDPHVKILPDDTQILNHDLGLPIVIAVPYAVGGRLGVELFLAICATLLAWQVYKLAFDVTHSVLWSTVSWGALSFTAPLVLYATLVYPEMLGALIFLWGTRTILFKPFKQISLLRFAALAGSIAALPWLSVRFIVLLTLLLLFIALKWSDARRAVFLAYAAAGAGLGLYVFINYVWLAGTVPSGSPSELAGGNVTTLSATSLARGVLGWWIDPQRGTLVMAPVYLLALVGVPRLVRTKPLNGVLLISPLLVLVPLVAAFGGFWIPFEVGARYFVVALPLLSAPLAVALQEIFRTRRIGQRIAFGLFAAIILAVSVWNGALMVSDASYAYGSVVSFYSRAVGADVSPLFASMGHAVVLSPDDPTQAQDSPNVQVEHRNGQGVWKVAAGAAGNIIAGAALTELTVGHYALNFRASAQGGAADAPALTLDLFSVEGLSIVHSEWNARELQASGVLPNTQQPPATHPVVVEFDNPYFDRWSSPLTLQLASTGNAELTVSGLRFEPDNATTWLRAASWVIGLLGVIVVFNLDWIRAQD